MSGGLKSGLLFGIIAIPVTIAASLIPFGILCCGPLFVLGLGVAAGYIAMLWNGGSSKIGQGILAGGITGAGSMIGSILLFVIIMALPEFDKIMQQAVAQQQTSSNLTPEDMKNLIHILGPIAGPCIGSFGLLFGLGGGALGFWIFQRRNRDKTPPAPPATPLEPPTVVG